MSRFCGTITMLLLSLLALWLAGCSLSALPDATPAAPGSAASPSPQPTAAAPTPVAITATPVEATSTSMPDQPAVASPLFPSPTVNEATQTAPDVEATSNAEATLEPSPMPLDTRAADSTRQKIMYLDADGKTIKTVRPDGSNPQLVTTVTKQDSDIVGDLVADPSGTYLLYSLSKEQYDTAPSYYIVQNGKGKLLRRLAQHPRWSPDGTRFVAQALDASGAPSAIYLYDAAAGSGTLLPKEGLPDWFPDGKRLVYVYKDDVYSYDLLTKESARLTNLPHDDSTNAWVITEAHVLPHGGRIIFFGQEYRQNGQIMVGASGNGLQWFSIPISGGTPTPWLDPEGNGLVAYSSSGTAGMIAYAGNAHSSACASIQNVSVVDAHQAQGKALIPDIPGFDEQDDHYVYIQGLTWSPDGSRIAFGVLPYTCTNAGSGPALDKPAVYMWQVTEDPSVKPVKVTNGSYPVWIETP